MIEVEELFALAFIFTIFVAFQGLFIFVIFILLSKQVREKYAKWWKENVTESDFLSKHFGEPTLNVLIVPNPAASLNVVTSIDAVNGQQKQGIIVRDNCSTVSTTLHLIGSSSDNGDGDE